MQICSDGKASHCRQQAFNTDQYEGVYDIHINYLKTIHSKLLTKYHRLMADLYKAASWVTLTYFLICVLIALVSFGTQVSQSDLGQASIDIEGMSE